MLTDTKLRSLKAQDKLYKVNDRNSFEKVAARTIAAFALPVKTTH